jgi:hypothetical protein
LGTTNLPLADRLIAIGLALGGAAGERLSCRLGYGIRNSTLLYLLAQLPLPAIVVSQTLGVDDFAFANDKAMARFWWI